MSAAHDQAPPLVSLQIEAGDFYRHAEYRRGNWNGHLVLECLEESRHLFVGVVRVDGDRIDELFE